MIEKIRKITISQTVIAQLAVSGIALGFLAWISVEVIKKLYYFSYPIIVYPWALTYFHPQDCALFNYLSLCFVLCLWGVVFYNQRLRTRIFEFGERLSFSIRTTALLASMAMLAVAPLLPFTYKSVALFLISVTPLIYLISLPSRRTVNWICMGFTVTIFFVLSWQVIQIMIGPVFLMSEYPQLFSKTIINDKTIDNRKFLEAMSNDDAEVIKNFLGIIKPNIEKNKKTFFKPHSADEDDVDFFLKSFKFENLNSLKMAILPQHRADTLEQSFSIKASRMDMPTFVDHL